MTVTFSSLTIRDFLEQGRCSRARRLTAEEKCNLEVREEHPLKLALFAALGAFGRVKVVKPIM